MVMLKPQMDYAKARLEERIRVGTDKAAELVQHVAGMVIRDRLVPPHSMQFTSLDGYGNNTQDLNCVHIRYDGGDLCTIHRHALNQLAAKVELPGSFVRKHNVGLPENQWRRELVAYVLNELYGNEKFIGRRGEPPKFLHRLVGNELRGFLTRSYNRQLASSFLLRAFLAACGEVGAAPVEATFTDIKVGLKCFLEQVFEPVPGEYVAIGMSWGNSDFGMGRMSVSLTTMRISSGTTSVLKDEISRVHLGSIIEESDIEMSEETAEKEAAAHASAIRDAVVGQLDPNPVQKLLDAIAAAHQRQIPWDRLKGQLGQFLYKEELTAVEAIISAGADSIIDLPPLNKDPAGVAIPTAWWASNVLGWMASKAEGERKEDLQTFAGKILGG